MLIINLFWDVQDVEKIEGYEWKGRVEREVGGSKLTWIRASHQVVSKYCGGDLHL